MSEATQLAVAHPTLNLQNCPTPSEFPEFNRTLALACGVCGGKGRYKVGHVMIAPELFDRAAGGLLDEDVGFTRLFHCRHCGAGGPWRLDGGSRVQLMVGLIIYNLGQRDIGLSVGELRTFDGRRFRYPSESVAHLHELIAREPERAFLWIRLGNLYKHAGRPDLAEEPYRRATELEPDNAEGHCCLADLWQGKGHRAKAAPHWKAVLRHARTAKHMPRQLRLDMVSAALEALLSSGKHAREAFDLLPRMDPGELAKRPKNEPVVLIPRTWDLTKPDDWDEVCGLFLGEPVCDRWRGAEWDDDDYADPERAVQYDVPRNAPCPCGSGHKYKKCCGRE
jgi:tetratricopeptide (TPR) repeat protein